MDKRIQALEARLKDLTQELAACRAELRGEVERRVAAEALSRKYEDRFRLLFEDNPLPMWVFDQETLRVHEVNGAAVSQYGYSREEFLGMSIAQLRPDEDVARLMQHRESLASGHRPLRHTGEWRHRTRSGHVIDVEVTAHDVDFAGRPATLVVIKDITDKKRAEKALIESERLARGVIDSALDAFVQVDGEGRVLDWNSTAHAMFGWSRQEALGQTLANLIIPRERRQDHLDTLARYRRGEVPPIVGRRVESPLVRRDGTTIRVEWSITAMQRGAAQVLNAFIRDQTEKIAAEESLRQAQKMEAVGQLTGGIAHDFNNLLTVIIGSADSIEEPETSLSAAKQLATTIRTVGERGAELTRRLLAFGRRQALAPTLIDLNAMVRGMETIIRRAIGEDIDVELALAGDLAPAFVDPSQVESAVLNLAVNSRHAMPDGGRLTIETADAELDEDYARRESEVEPGRYVMIAVTDTGSGMAPEVVRRAFEPFFTTKGVGKGSGLGLSQVYGFVKQSKGHVKIYSEPGHGTTVKIYLPRAAAADVPVAKIPGGADAMPPGSETILVVEDDELVRNYAVVQLTSLGYRILEARDGPEAMSLLAQNDGIDLLFTDVILPKGMKGPEVAARARALRPSIRVLYTSGYTENAIVHQGRLDPGVHLLVKPFRKADLAKKVRTVLDEAPPS